MKLSFNRLVQDSQDFGSDDDHMISRAFFAIFFEDAEYLDCSVDLKQIVGSDIESSPIEVSNLQGYEGPMNRDKLQESAELYYRQSFGSSGSFVRFSKNTKNIRMRNNIRELSIDFEFEVDSHVSGGGW